MPNMDKTGPAGQGPMKGRGMGNCAKSNKVAVAPRGMGQGQGQGRGRGRFSSPAGSGDFSSQTEKR